MAAFADICRFNPTVGGTADWTYASAVVGCQSPTAANVQNGIKYKYRAESSDLSQWEMGEGAYNSSTGVLARTTVLYNSSGTGTATPGQTGAGAKINFTTIPQVAIVALAEDVIPAEALGFGLSNVGLAASVASSILTVTLTDRNGNTPSNNSPVVVNFRSSTAATGATSPDAITSSLSISTFATGATLGSANNTPFRLWVLIFDNGGTPVLALFNASSASTLYPLHEEMLLTTVAISGSATSAGVAYTPNGTTLTSKAFRILGHIDFESGLTTAGTYASGPTKIQVFGPGIKRPGDAIQTTSGTRLVQDSWASGGSYSSTNLSASITPTSTVNYVLCEASGAASLASVDEGYLIIQRGGVNVGIGKVIYDPTALVTSDVKLKGMDAPGSAGPLTYTVAGKCTSGHTFYFPLSDGATCGGEITCTEVMA